MILLKIWNNLKIRLFNQQESLILKGTVMERSSEVDSVVKIKIVYPPMIVSFPIEKIDYPEILLYGASIIIRFGQGRNYHLIHVERDPNPEPNPLKDKVLETLKQIK